MKTKRVLIAGATAILSLAIWAAPASAVHDHYVKTPNGKCHQVAAGQTRIAANHGGYHRFHLNVHFGATETEPGENGGDSLGDGNANVQVFKDRCA